MAIGHLSLTGYNSAAVLRAYYDRYDTNKDGVFDSQDLEQDKWLSGNMYDLLGYDDDQSLTFNEFLGFDLNNDSTINNYELSKQAEIKQLEAKEEAYKQAKASGSDTNPFLNNSIMQWKALSDGSLIKYDNVTLNTFESLEDMQKHKETVNSIASLAPAITPPEKGESNETNVVQYTLDSHSSSMENPLPVVEDKDKPITLQLEKVEHVRETSRFRTARKSNNIFKKNYQSRLRDL